MHRYTGPFKFNDPKNQYITYMFGDPLEINTIIRSGDGSVAVVTNCEKDIYTPNWYKITIKPYQEYRPSFLVRLWYRFTTWIKKLFNRKKA